MTYLVFLRNEIVESDEEVSVVNMIFNQHTINNKYISLIIIIETIFNEYIIYFMTSILISTRSTKWISFLFCNKFISMYHFLSNLVILAMYAFQLAYHKS